MIRYCHQIVRLIKQCADPCNLIQVPSLVIPQQIECESYLEFDILMAHLVNIQAIKYRVVCCGSLGQSQGAYGGFSDGCKLKVVIWVAGHQTLQTLCIGG